MRTVSLLSATLSVALSISAAAAAGPVPFAKEPFSDVPKTHANYTAIEYLRKNAILRGYLDGTFRPNRSITRAEFVLLATNPFFISGEGVNDCLLTEVEEGSNRIFYWDVDRSDWFADAVCIATVKGLVHGYADGSFKPRHYISFAESAKILASVFALQTNQDPHNPQWYVPYVKSLATLKAIPISVTRFDEDITRGEMAEMLYRLKADVRTKGSMTFEGLR